MLNKYKTNFAKHGACTSIYDFIVSIDKHKDHHHKNNNITELFCTLFLHQYNTGFSKRFLNRNVKLLMQTQLYIVCNQWYVLVNLQSSFEIITLVGKHIKTGRYRPTSENKQILSVNFILDLNCLYYLGHQKPSDICFDASF